MYESVHIEKTRFYFKTLTQEKWHVLTLRRLTWNYSKSITIKYLSRAIHFPGQFWILQNRILHLRFRSTIDFHISITIGTWNTSLVSLSLKTAIFWKGDLRKKLFTSKFYQILVLIFRSPPIHDLRFWALFPLFANSDVIKK